MVVGDKFMRLIAWWKRRDYSGKELPPFSKMPLRHEKTEPNKQQYHPYLPDPAVVPATSPTPQEQSKRKPRLVWSAYQFINVTYDKESELWRERRSQYSSKAIVFHFTNELYPDGKGEPARLRAQVSWIYDNDSPGPTFSPAAWVDEQCGTVEIPVGWAKKLIIGIKSGSEGGYYWDGYSNPRMNTSNRHALDGQMVPSDGKLIIRLIGDTNEVWYEQGWKWREDIEHGSHPHVTLDFLFKSRPG